MEGVCQGQQRAQENENQEQSHWGDRGSCSVEQQGQKTTHIYNSVFPMLVTVLSASHILTHCILTTVPVCR